MSTYCPDGEVRKVWKHLLSTVEYSVIEVHRKNAKRDLDGALGTAVTVPFNGFVTVVSQTNSTNATITVPLEDSLEFSTGDVVTFYDNSGQTFSTESKAITSLSGTTITLDGEWSTPPAVEDEVVKVTTYTDHIVIGPPPQILRRALQISVYFGKLGILGGPIPIHDSAVINYRDALAWIERVKSNREKIDDTAVSHGAYSTHSDYHPVTYPGSEMGWHEDASRTEMYEDEWNDD